MDAPGRIFCAGLEPLRHRSLQLALQVGLSLRLRGRPGDGPNLQRERCPGGDVPRPGVHVAAIAASVATVAAAPIAAAAVAAAAVAAAASAAAQPAAFRR